VGQASSPSAELFRRAHLWRGRQPCCGPRRKVGPTSPDGRDARDPAQARTRAHSGGDDQTPVGDEAGRTAGGNGAGKGGYASRCISIGDFGSARPMEISQRPPPAPASGKWRLAPAPGPSQVPVGAAEVPLRPVPLPSLSRSALSSGTTAAEPSARHVPGARLVTHR
jgi:hypothetical protein